MSPSLTSPCGVFVFSNCTLSFTTLFSTLLDFLPTIANLYDYSYDEKCVLGRDIFDPSYNGFFFANYGELANDYYRYDMLTDSFYYTNGYDTDKAEQEIVGFERLLDISKKILKIDYYKTKETN